jgi:hypothetical protein
LLVQSYGRDGKPSKISPPSLPRSPWYSFDVAVLFHAARIVTAFCANSFFMHPPPLCHGDTQLFLDSRVNLDGCLSVLFLVDSSVRSYELTWPSVGHHSRSSQLDRSYGQLRRNTIEQQATLLWQFLYFGCEFTTTTRLMSAFRERIMQQVLLYLRILWRHRRASNGLFCSSTRYSIH